MVLCVGFPVLMWGVGRFCGFEVTGFVCVDSCVVGDVVLCHR